MNCRICGNLTKLFSIGSVFDKNVKFFECNYCEYVQTEKPYWLEKAYASPINLCDTGILNRNQANLGIVLATLSVLSKRDGFVIDFAGGYGILVRLLRDKGVNALWADTFCENLLATGFEYNNEEAVLVTAFEAFEHFVDPILELEKLFTIAPNLLISTQIIPTPSPRLDSWWYYGLDHGQHIGFYRIKTLEFLAKKYGKYFLSDGICNHLFSDRPLNSLYWKIAIKIARKFPAIFSFGLKSKTLPDFMKMKVRK